MGKYRDHRQPRSDRFENDHDTHSEPDYFQGGSETRAPAPPTASATSPVSAAEVLWFNAEKGFGFVRLSDGSDAFLHVSKLQAVGQTSLPEGAKLQVLVEVSAKGKPQVSQIVSIASGQKTTPLLRIRHHSRLGRKRASARSRGMTGSKALVSSNWKRAATTFSFTPQL